MKLVFLNSKRKRIVSGICALLIAASGVTAVLYSRAGTASQKAINNSGINQSGENAGKSKDSGTISAGGTVSSEQLCDYLGMESTSIRLKIDSVLVESGDSVEEGSAIYKLTEDSLQKAEKTLNNELQSAQSSLLSQKMSYTEDKNSAYALYQSELLLGDTVSSDYESGLESLDSSLQKALDSYEEARNTINNTPSEISNKQAELNSKQAETDMYQEQANNKQNEVNFAKSDLESATGNYNSAASDYNAAAGTVRFIGAYLGIDVSDVQLADKKQSSAQNNNDNAGSNDAPSFGDSGNGPGGNFSGDFGNAGDFKMERTSYYSSPLSSTDSLSDSLLTDIITTNTQLSEMIPSDFQKTDGAPPDKSQQPEVSSENESSSRNELMNLYEKARSEYEQTKNALSDAERQYNEAESTYQNRQSELSDINSSLKNCQNDVSSLSKEISSLNTKLNQAKSNVSELLSSYNSLKASYDTDKLELKKTYDSDESSFSNAEYHYQVTLATIEEELEAAQKNYDTAAENLRIYKEVLADGVIEAKQSGIIYSVSYEEGNSLSVSSPLVYYVNEETFYTTVELNQYDVTQINLGDSVIMYSSETGMTNGTVTGITSGESTSLADVNFNVTITAEDGSGLYSGQSVNVYFNAGNMNSSNFTDFEGKSGDSENNNGAPSGFGQFGGSQGGSRPDFNSAGFSRDSFSRKED